MIGIEPNHSNTNGMTPSCAAVVAEKMELPRCGVIAISPAVAATDNTNPTDHVASGSTETMLITVKASARSGNTSRPIAYPTCTTPAMTAARITLDSRRVITANIATTPRAAESRHQRVKRRNIGVSAAKMSTTFCPDTARRCPSPAPRNASVIRDGWRDSSPNTNPRTRAASLRCMVRAPRSTSSWIRFAARCHSVGAGAVACTVILRNSPCT